MMKVSRRKFIQQSITGVAAAGVLGSAPLRSESTASGNSAAMLKKDSGLPEPATFDRLPMSWYKRQIAALKEKMKEKEVDAIWLRDPLNITYFTGYYFISTERPYSVLLPVHEDAL